MHRLASFSGCKQSPLQHPAVLLEAVRKTEEGNWNMLWLQSRPAERNSDQTESDTKAASPISILTL